MIERLELPNRVLTRARLPSEGSLIGLKLPFDDLEDIPVRHHWLEAHRDQQVSRAVQYRALTRTKGFSIRDRSTDPRAIPPFERPHVPFDQLRKILQDRGIEPGSMVLRAEEICTEINGNEPRSSGESYLTEHLGPIAEKAALRYGTYVLGYALMHDSDEALISRESKKRKRSDPNAAKDILDAAKGVLIPRIGSHLFHHVRWLSKFPVHAFHQSSTTPQADLREKEYSARIQTLDKISQKLTARIKRGVGITRPELQSLWEGHVNYWEEALRLDRIYLTQMFMDIFNTPFVPPNISTADVVEFVSGPADNTPDGVELAQWAYTLTSQAVEVKKLDIWNNAVCSIHQLLNHEGLGRALRLLIRADTMFPTLRPSELKTVLDELRRRICYEQQLCHALAEEKELNAYYTNLWESDG